MKTSMPPLAAAYLVAIALLAGGCSSDPIKEAVEATEAIAAEAEKAGADCDKFAAAAKPIAEKSAGAFAKMKNAMKSGDEKEGMKKFAEYVPRMGAVREKMKALKANCRKHEGTAAVMKMLRGR